MNMMQTIPASAPLIDIVALSKRYSRGDTVVPIFDNLSLSIPRGRFVALMGPSGSGKTTLLNMLAGIDRPSSGALSIDGARIDRYGEAALAEWRARTLGFIFQFYNLMPMLTAAQNVELPLLLQRMHAGERRRRVETALEVVGLSDRMKHRPRELSGGQQQRVAIARALVADPKLILADEPTGDLDRPSADGVLEILRLLSSELGKTIVMVTHDPVAARAADLTLHLEKGRFVDEAIAA
ncbi:putative ABC transporter ATP-binding protein YknY [Sphingomonas sp. S2M10]|uniref:ABC transporter ATP-binding protein n=1 Tax=Sphingomonas sp. S2M10 TaxID=2705010 RepID=UPI0016905F0D|nr:ABC transporter ATP-binding protein [Sphingomonas sp. S2M10]NLS27598.1 putative ABC transporter ATP-binding protein YknY [Sphingomonas sp. S2M10]